MYIDIYSVACRYLRRHRCPPSPGDAQDRPESHVSHAVLSQIRLDQLSPVLLAYDWCPNPQTRIWQLCVPTTIWNVHRRATWVNHSNICYYLKPVNAPGCRLRMEKAPMFFNAGSSTALTARRIYIHMYTYLNNYMYIFEIQLRYVIDS